MFMFLMIWLVVGFGDCSSERILYERLFDNYTRFVRPVRNASTAVEVKVGFGLVILENHDEIRQVFISQGVLQITWSDDNLQWSTEEFQIKRMTVPVDRIWIPDLTILNDVNGNVNVKVNGVTAAVYHTGQVELNLGRRRETYCRVDVSKFPFDAQNCCLRVSQMASIRPEVNLEPKSNFVDLSGYLGNNGEYTVQQTTVRYFTSNLTEKTEIQFNVTFSRKSFYYIKLCVLPVMLLSVLNLAVFLVPAASGEKLTLGISVFLSYAVFLTIIYGFLPEISDTISLFGVYLSVMLCVKVVTLVFAVWVLRVHYTIQSGPPPSWIRSLCACHSQSKKYPTNNNTTDVDEKPWQSAASILDRILFIIFSTVTILITLLFFVVMTRDRSYSANGRGAFTQT